MYLWGQWWKMRILVASHTYVIDQNNAKFKELVLLDRSIEVTIVTPSRWNAGGVHKQIIKRKPHQDSNIRIIPVFNFSLSHQGLLTFGPMIIPLLKQFKPDVIQVEQGIKSLAYAQFIMLSKILKIEAKNCFFSWWNIPYDRRLPYRWLEDFNLRHTDAFIAGNQDAANIIQSHGYKGPIRVLPNLGINENLFYPRRQPDLAICLGIQPKDFMIGYVGRFVFEKGITTLIKALENLKDLSWKLLLLGRGKLRSKIIEQTEKGGMKNRLIIVDSVPHENVPQYINLLNTLVLPSETNHDISTLSARGWKEQFGHVLIEAMACKVPVIGSDCGEIPNVVGDAGIIFPEGDSRALEDCLRTLMEQPSLGKKLGEIGYRRVMKKYTNKALASELLEFYRQVF